MAWYSQTWNWFDGDWHEGNPPLVGPRSHVIWQGSSVFDGARFFDGVAPDLDLHAARVNRSATALGLKYAFINQPVEAAPLRGEFACFLGIGLRRPDIVMRFGMGPDLPKSLRRPPQQVMVPA